MKLSQLLKEAKGQQALFIGRFQPISKRHQKIILQATKNFNKVFVAVISGRNAGKEENNFLSTSEKLKLIKRVIQHPNIIIKSFATGYVPDIIHSFGAKEKDITIICGEDRGEAYKRFGVNVQIIPRGEYATSATTIRKAIIDNNFTKYKNFIAKGLDNRADFVALQRLMNRVLTIKEAGEKKIDEGGNVFDDSVSIKKEDIKPTMKILKAEMKRIFPKINFGFELLGSAGKKAISGDLDVAIDISIFFKDGKPRINDFGFDKKKYEETFNKYKTRARTSTDQQIHIRTMLTLMLEKIKSNSNLFVVKDKVTGTMTSVQFPIFTNRGKTSEKVQVDFMTGNMDWLKFSYHSEVYEGGIKGLHRTQLLVALFDYKGYMFKHDIGVLKKEDHSIVAQTPDESRKLLNKLYNTNITDNDFNNFFTLYNAIKIKLSEKQLKELLKIYFKILDSTRCDIPEILQPYWLRYQKEFGLTGKFLPDESKLKKYQILKESGVAGGDRVVKANAKEIFNAFAKKILKPYVESKGEKWNNDVASITGSLATFISNDANKDETSGDIDVVFTTRFKNIAEEKKKFIEYISKLPDTIIAPFKSEKYKGKKYYNAGELVSILFPFGPISAQIDVIFSKSKEETEFKQQFLNLPAEIQGLIIGWAKCAMLELPDETINKTFRKLGVKREQLPANYEYEFNLSSSGLEIRKVELIKKDGKISSGAHISLGRSQNWQDFINIFPFDLYKATDANTHFKELVNEIANKLKNPRSKFRIFGTFKGLITIKSGEVGTPKGEKKKQATEYLKSKLNVESKALIDYINLLEREL